MLRLLHWVWGSGDGVGEYLPHWTSDRVKAFERATMKYDGRQYEVCHPWSRKFRKESQAKKLQFARKVG